MKRNILVLGGTGKTGRRIAKKLTAQGHHVRIGSRGATPSFDWDQPAGWPAVLEGMEKVYITYQPDLAVPGAKEAIAALTRAAREKGVQQLVLLSGKGETEAEHCEQIVLSSGIESTILRASWFNQNFSESFFLENILQGVVALPKADSKAPYVDADDLADAAVAVLTEEGHGGKIYELTGPRLLSFRDTTEEIAKATGRTLTFIPITLPEYVEGMRGQGLPEDLIWLMEYLFTHVLDNPKNQVVTGDIEKILGHKPKDFAEFARETAASGIWDAVAAQ